MSRGCRGCAVRIIFRKPGWDRLSLAGALAWVSPGAGYDSDCQERFPGELRRGYAIAQTVAEKPAKCSQLAASFFSRFSPDRNAPKHLFPTITLQISLCLLINATSSARYLLRDDPYITHRASGSIDLLVSLFCDQSGMLPDGQIVTLPRHY